MTLFVRPQSFLSLPSFIFVNVAVSEICELNQNKKEKKKKKNSDIYSKTFPCDKGDMYVHVTDTEKYCGRQNLIHVQISMP